MLEPVNPESLGAPSGYNNGMVAAPDGRLLFVAGQIAWDADHNFVSRRFPEQFAQALRNVVEVVRHAGGGPEHIASMRIYVVDKREYRNSLREVGRSYREIMGRNYPAMALVEVQALLEDDARVEIEATAVLPA